MSSAPSTAVVALQYYAAPCYQAMGPAHPLVGVTVGSAHWQPTVYEGHLVVLPSHWSMKQWAEPPGHQLSMSNS